MDIKKEAKASIKLEGEVQGNVKQLIWLFHLNSNNANDYYKKESNEPQVEKFPVDIANVGRKCWLLKVPPILAEELEKADGEKIGEIRFPANPKDKSLTLRLVEKYRTRVGNEFTFSLREEQNFKIFSRTPRGFLKQFFF